MAALQNIPVSVATDEKSNQGQFTAEIFSNSERWLRAAMLWLAGWAIGIAIVPIPVVHWATPMLALGSPIAAYFRYRTLHQKSRLEFDCPACEKHVEMPLSGDQLPPVYIYCPKCDKGLKIDRS